MATAVKVEASPRRQREPFPARRPTDYNFFLIYVLLIWLAAAMGGKPPLAGRNFC